MGVCKCKQRNVTNQFCYVCRMNVCESCIVKDHQRCIIKSYVHWLQDSDYNAICLLCMESINTGEVIRLTCYDIFHWDCFNAWALKHSEYTPVSGYQCPDCKAPVFPPTALISPVADVIRQKFSTVGWGRRCLGLPPQPSHQAHTPQVASTSNDSLQLAGTPGSMNINPTATSTPKSTYKAPIQTKAPFVPLPKQYKQSAQEQEQQSKTLSPHQEQQKQLKQQPAQPQQPSQQQQQQQQQQHTPVAATYQRDKAKVIDSRRYDDAKINVSYDHDDNKYKRKGFKHWLGNLLSLNQKPTTAKKEGGGVTFKRVIIALILFSIAFMTVLYFMSSYGRSFAAYDPLLDPDKNPNIRVVQDPLLDLDKNPNIRVVQPPDYPIVARR